MSSLCQVLDGYQYTTCNLLATGANNVSSTRGNEMIRNQLLLYVWAEIRYAAQHKGYVLREIISAQLILPMRWLVLHKA